MAAEGSSDPVHKRNISMTDAPNRFDTSNVPSIFSSNQGLSSSPRTSKTLPSLKESSEPSRPPKVRSSSIIGLTDPATRALSPDATDRVFPVRSFVSVEPTPTSSKVEEDVAAVASRRASAFTTPTTPSDMTFSSRVLGQPTPNVSHTSSDAKNTNILSLDESRFNRQSQAGGEEDGARQHVIGASGHGYNLRGDAASVGSGSIGSSAIDTHSRLTRERPSSRNTERSAQDPDYPGGLVTARFKHVVTEEGHAVITGRDGETLQRCEDEPIRIPGAVQSFGALMALEETADGKLLVRIVSENSKRVIGYTPKQLFALSSFTDILSEEQADNLLDHIDFIKDDDGSGVENSGPEVFTMSIRHHLHRRSSKLWCAIHINESNPGVIICEFELEDDPDFPLVPLHSNTPDLPEDTLDSQPTQQEYLESTQAQSRPLRVLRGARKRKGEAAAMEVFNIMSQVQEQLAEAPTLDQFLKVLVGVIKELSGFHRVMIYQFDKAFNGKVVTELVDPRATKDLYKGLHFPASDIPKQARDLYKINRVRLLYDRDQETARLVCRTLEDLEKPLDLTHSYLRAMSPIHVKYLANMAVRSSMSISITAFNELWGLISCHAYGNNGTRVSFPIRKMCRLVGDSASRNIERLSYASRLQARRLINTSPTDKNPSGYIVASSDDLLKLFDADFGLLSIHDETKILGKLEATQEALVLLEYLRVRKFTSVMTSQDIRDEFPDLNYPPGFTVIAGLLLVPLSVGGGDFIVFFRKGQLKEVRWAGNPYEKFVREGTEGYLEPRKSFKTWSETVVGKCREWNSEEIETAAVLCLVYGKFIEVWRQKEAALQNTQLTKLLLANSAHEVRTPLNAIINFLEIALEGSIDQETRENLAKSHSASKSLIYVINDLLDLTRTEVSGELVFEETFNICNTFREAVEPYAGDARRKQIDFDTVEHPGLPESVIGDQRKVRQAISNIMANAIQATSVGGISAEMMVVAQKENHVDIEVIVQDTGVGMTAQQLDALFVELEQAQSENLPMAAVEETFALNSKPHEESAEEKKKEKNPRTLGLGLAVVARVVRNMNGQLRLKSEVGKGSRFVIHFPFDLPESQRASTNTLASPPSLGQLPKSESAPSLIEPRVLSSRQNQKATGEVTLVEKPHGSPVSDTPLLSRHNSAGSAGSLTSRKSFNSLNSGRSLSSAHSGKSEVDRLIEAMQEPHMIDLPSRKQGSSGGNKRPRSFRQSSYNESGSPARSRAHFPESTGKVPQHFRSIEPSSRGYQALQDQMFPVQAIKVPDDEPVVVSSDTVSQASRSSLDAAQAAGGPTNPPHEQPTLRVLVAEDDPINSRIVNKRLTKMGHDTYLTVNGEECSRAFEENSSRFDVVLMDMQMPIVDGLTATKMIRSFEKTHSSDVLSRRAAAANGRVPIFAVSASLVEKDYQTYINAGFDGWILKPISFSRLSELLEGMENEDVRTKNLYRPGEWERGGWFHKNVLDTTTAATTPTERVPYSLMTSAESSTQQAQPDLPVPAEDDKGNGSASDASSLTATQERHEASPAPLSGVNTIESSVDFEGDDGQAKQNSP